MKRVILITVILLAGQTIGYSQDLPVSDKTSRRILSNDENIEIDTEYKRLYEQLKAAKDEGNNENRELKEKLRKFQEKQYKNKNSYHIPVESPSEMGNKLGNTRGNKRKKRGRSVSTGYQTSSGMKVFAVNDEADEDTTVLPAGAWVRAKLLTALQEIWRTLAYTSSTLIYFKVGIS